ncbi:hypothetical protein CU097_000681, partial [Rhizopus azygosporus]
WHFEIKYTQKQSTAKNRWIYHPATAIARNPPASGTANGFSAGYYASKHIGSTDEDGFVTPCPSPWHSLGIRPQFDWPPPEFLAQGLQLDRYLFSTEHIITDDERRELIKSYPALRNIEYKPPSTLPAAQRCMNKTQQLEDSSLRDLQYFLSGVFRPLDILGNELLQSTNVPPESLGRHLDILNHARTLLINACATVTYNRNKIALRAVNPRFTAPALSTQKKYTMASENSHQAITQKMSAAKGLREARIARSAPAMLPLLLIRSRYFGQGNRQTMSTGAHPKNNLSAAESPVTLSASHSQPPVSGFFQLFSPHWDRLFHNNWVNTIVQHGFKIPFRTPPPLSTDCTSHQHPRS